MQWIAKGRCVHALNSYKSMVTELNRLFRLHLLLCMNVLLCMYTSIRAWVRVLYECMCYVRVCVFRVCNDTANLIWQKSIFKYLWTLFLNVTDINNTRWVCCASIPECTEMCGTVHWWANPSNVLCVCTCIIVTKQPRYQLRKHKASYLRASYQTATAAGFPCEFPRVSVGSQATKIARLSTNEPMCLEEYHKFMKQIFTTWIHQTWKESGSGLLASALMC